MKDELQALTEEEESLIEEKINAYADSMAPSEPHTEEERLPRSRRACMFARAVIGSVFA